MNCKFTNVLIFAVGAAVGSAVTWKVMKTKYEQIVQEEIESIKEAFSNKIDDNSDAEESRVNWEELEDLDEEEDEEEVCESDSDLDEYAKIANTYTSEEGGANNMAKEPYVISPYDFGEIEEYNQIELTYYADGILEDEDYEIVTDVYELIGVGSLNTFGEYEDDSVFVRNEKLRADFQILKDYRTYEEAHKVAPNQVDDE